MSQHNLLKDPIEQFKLWYEEAVQNERDPDAMALATADLKAQPSVRTVLYKGISEGGFLIFTNYDSRKGRELSENPRAAWVFYWPKSYKQVRAEGYVERLTRQASEDYFKSRPYESQLAAWISEQSREISDRDYLLSRYEEYHRQFKDKVPCPEHWGGFRLMPDQMEFWIGREHRLHDRFCYQKKRAEWGIHYLAP